MIADIKEGEVGMTEREQVISELLYLKHDCLEGSATDQTLDKAIALLKAQEPRVMSLEEYKAWMDIPFCERDPILLEMKSRRGAVTWWTNTAECSIENYGKTERCWTSRPDEKRRAETPWE